MPIDLPNTCSPYPPYHPDGVTSHFPVGWLSDTVRALTYGIRAEGAFDRMPILADALEDAGCDELLVLNHCRFCSRHQSDCWVIGRILPPDELYWAGNAQDRHADAVAQAIRQGHPDDPAVVPGGSWTIPPGADRDEVTRIERRDRWAMRVMWVCIAIGMALILKSVFRL